MSTTLPKIAIILIHYNTPHFLKTCLDSIINQTYKNIDTYFIDNNSPEKTGLKFVEKTYKEKIKIIANTENLGYAKAANQGIKLAIEQSNADYIVITNPDIIYSPTYFEKVLYRAESGPKIAAITGKVYKYDFEAKKPTKIIDTVGLYIDKSLRVTDGGQGTLDEGQYEIEKEIFGISGACPMYRKEALEAVKMPNGECFDEDFFMYKEDVDLSWRFQLAGYKCLYTPKAVAFHGRGTGAIERRTMRQIFKNRKNLSKFQRHYSFRNQHLMCFKNTPIKTYLRYFPYIFLRDALAMFYVLIYEPFLFKAVYEYFRILPRAFKKRLYIMKGSKIQSKNLNRWMKAKI